MFGEWLHSEPHGQIDPAARRVLHAVSAGAGMGCTQGGKVYRAILYQDGYNGSRASITEPD